MLERATRRRELVVSLEQRDINESTPLFEHANASLSLDFAITIRAIAAIMRHSR